MVISKRFEYHAFIMPRNDGMKQKKSTLISTAIIGYNCEKQSLRRRLVLHGSPPYVISVKTERIGREPAEATADVDPRYVLDGHASAENKGLRRNEHSNNNSTQNAR
jgi:hypothetical protein